MSVLEKRLPATSSSAPVSSANAPDQRLIGSFPGAGAIDLNAFDEPAVTIDRAGRVVEANSEMKSLLGKNIRIRNNRLIISDALARSRLQGLMQAIGAESNASDIQPIVLKCDDDSPVVLRIMAIPEAAQRLFLDASAILTFVRLRPRPRPAPSLLLEIFQLTPAEARLAAALADGSTLMQTAKALNISWETARTQLKAVFVKTDTHRQGELIALLSRV